MIGGKYFQIYNRFKSGGDRCTTSMRVGWTQVTQKYSGVEMDDPKNWERGGDI